MKLKLIAAAVAVFALSGGARADTAFDLGEVLGTRPIGNTVLPGSFVDTFTFTVGGPSLVSAIALNTSYLITPPGLTLGKIDAFAASLDGVPLSSTITSTPLAPGVAKVDWMLSLTGGPIPMFATGPHTLTIAGMADASGPQYTGSITVTAVPEPETYALMVAGLGAVSFLARRRRNA